MAEVQRFAAQVGRISAVVLAAVIAAQSLVAADRLHLIGNVDISGTQEAKGFSGRSEFEQNIQAVTRVLANLPAGSRVSILGVTDRTLENPFVLLSGGLSDDPGYFESRLVKGRRTLINEWTRRTKDLEPIAPHTDLLGAFQYASERFSQSNAECKVLTFFSDMRQERPGVLDLERPEVIDVAKSIRQVEKQGFIMPLQGVQIYVFGAGDHAGRNGPEYLSTLKAFWAEYARRCGADLRLFSTARDLEALADLAAFGRPKISLPSVQNLNTVDCYERRTTSFELFRGRRSSER